MTERIKSLTVILEKDYRIDDMDNFIIPALKQMKGVVDVKANVVNPDDYAARARVRSELANSFIKLYEEIVK